jgi:hypothetical protein
MESEQGRDFTIKDVERGARARVDFEEQNVLPIHDEIGRG